MRSNRSDSGCYVSCVRWVAVVTALSIGCSPDQPASAQADAGCNVLFGRPNDMTGLTSEQCQPRCGCGADAFVAPEYTPADIDDLASWTLLEPPAPLDSDPYAEPTPADPGPDTVCGVIREGAAREYRLTTFSSEADARAKGAIPTHFGACGRCSPLVDLAVYMRRNDLTQPVRECGVRYFKGPAADHIKCLQDLGFSYPCAQIWYFNTVHTRDVCSAPCVAALGKPYHLEDGGLNDCLVCDEEKSGPVFKAIAGRTRRNTGLPNAMCRPCNEVRPLAHVYR